MFQYQLEASRKLLEIVPNADISTLPAEAASYDPTDDAIVLASALSANCTYLATLSLVQRGMSLNGDGISTQE